MSANYYKNLKCRVKRGVHKINEEKMLFMRTFALSYLVAFVIVLFSLVFECEAIGSEGKYCFANCKDINMFSYIVFSLIQTLITTTIPFASTIFVLQTDEKRHKTIKVFVMILIIVLALLCAAQSALTTLETMWAVSIFSLILIIITVISCRVLFCVSNETVRPIKKERSDGKPTT